MELDTENFRPLRFTEEMFDEAKERLNTLRESALVGYGHCPDGGSAMMLRLGWPVVETDRLVAEMAGEILADGGDDDVAVLTALMVGLMLGNVATDLSWEKSFGL